MRATVSAGAAGVRAVAIVATGFVAQARAVAHALGERNLRVVEIPGVLMTESPASIRTTVLEHVVEPLTVQLTARGHP